MAIFHAVKLCLWRLAFRTTSSQKVSSVDLALVSQAPYQSFSEAQLLEKQFVQSAGEWNGDIQFLLKMFIFEIISWIHVPFPLPCLIARNQNGLVLRRYDSK